MTAQRAKSGSERNTATDTDHEAFSLHRFIDLLVTGQPIAIEMMFAPESAMTGRPDPLWQEVQALAPRVVTRGAASFVRYCRQQANRYGIRGSRVADARKALGILAAACASHGAQTRLANIEHELEDLVATTVHLSLSDIEVQPGRVVRHFDVCGRKAPLTTSIASARDLAARLVAEYGQRALDAERHAGIDWKALSHAVRVGQEAIELLRTGRLVLPLADAQHLLAIKLGRLPYAEVADEIERLLAVVEETKASSLLPDVPNVVVAEDLVVRAYRRRVLEDAQ